MTYAMLNRPYLLPDIIRLEQAHPYIISFKFDVRMSSPWTVKRAMDEACQGSIMWKRYGANYKKATYSANLRTATREDHDRAMGALESMPGVLRVSVPGRSA